MNAILALDDIKTALGIPGTDTSKDTALTAAMPVITEYFENYCKRGLAYVPDETEEMDVVPRLPLFRFPIDVITELLVDGAAATPLSVDKAHGFVRMAYGPGDTYLGYFPCGRVSITYSGGYPQDAVPADLADAYAKACADYGGVAYVNNAATGGGAPLKSLGLGSGALTVAFETGAAVANTYDTSSVPPILAPYLFTLEHYRVKDFV